MKRFHALEKQPSLLRMSRLVRPRSAASGLGQTGGGVADESDSGDTETDIDVESESETGERETAEEEESETDDSSSDGSDADDDDDAGEHWVFNHLLLETENELDEDNPVSYERLQKLFRKKYADYLVWFNDLRKNSIHKKVMATAREFTDHPEYYDRNEALRAAVRQRKFLLNRLVPRPESLGDQDVEDSED